MIQNYGDQKLKTKERKIVEALFREADIKIGGDNPWDIAVHNERFYRLSTIRVTGPSLISDTAITARNWPVFTLTPFSFT